MGLLELNRFLAMRRDRRRRPIQGHNGLVTSAARTKDSPCPRGDSSRSERKMKYSAPRLPEDIWHHIHSILPLRDAARVACVSHSFRHSWRRYPNLTITRKTLGLEDEMSSSFEISSALASITNQILGQPSRIGVKALRLEINDFPMFSTSCDLDRWLYIAVRPGIEKLDLWLKLHSYGAAVYNFPCPLLLDGSGKSIQDLHLSNCAFRPTGGFGCLRSLTSLSLCFVHITGDELRCLLSSSVALLKLKLVYCNEITFLEIPSLLQRLSHLVVNHCKNLEVIESRAPNLYSFSYAGALVPLSLGDSLQNLKLFWSSWDVFHYTCKNHPHMVPTLEALDISTYVADTLVLPVPDKFLHLRRLSFGYISPDYDYLSLVPFLDACPSLETFKLVVEPVAVGQESVLGDSSHDLRRMPGHLHRSIKDVQITGFCRAKSMVELTCCILENAKSLERLTISTFDDGGIFCSSSKTGECLPMSRDRIIEAHKALLVVQRYIVEKVPSSVELKVIEPCSRCNPLEF